LSDKEKVKELIERINVLTKKGHDIDARMKKLEQLLAMKNEKTQ
jgi:hypothetical protein